MDRKFSRVLFCIVVFVLTVPTTFPHTPRPPRSVDQCYACGTGMPDYDCTQGAIDDCRDHPRIPGVPGLPPGSGGDKSVTRPPPPDELTIVCMKRILLGVNIVDKSCWFPSPEDNNETRQMECKTAEGFTECLCDTDLCNEGSVSGSIPIFGVIGGILGNLLA